MTHFAKPATPVADPGEPLLKSLELALLCEGRGGTTVRDHSGQRRNASLTGTTSTDPGWGSGPSGPCLMFPAAAGIYSPLTGLPALGNTLWTIQLRFRTEAVTGSTAEPLFSLNSPSILVYNGHPSTSYRCSVTCFGPTSAFPVAKVATSFTPGVWYDLTGRFDGSNLDAFLNGVMVARVAVAGNSGTGSTTGLGWDGSNLAGGVSYDAVLLWSRALSDGEIVRVTADPFSDWRQPTWRNVWTSAATPPTGTIPFHLFFSSTLGV